MIGISAIGWENEQENQILSVHAGAFDFIEIVPFKIFANKESPVDMAKRYKEQYGLQPYSAQALFYNSTVQSFEDITATSAHLLRVIDLSLSMGVKCLVLGSPALRRGSPSSLMEALKQVDTVLQASNITLCIEPIAQAFNGKYFYTVEEIANYINCYKLHSVKTMLDTNNAWLQGDNPKEIMASHSDLIAHVHVSDSDNGPILNEYEHKQIKKLLDANGYQLGITRELIKASRHAQDYSLFKQIYG